MSDSYVCSTAKIKCSCGDKISTLTVYPDRTVFLTGQPQANISDHKSMYNIAPFGKCHTVCYPATGSATAANHGKLTPMPCVPGTVTEWLRGKEDVLIKGKPALLKSSYCQCQFGGVITVTFDGQTDTGQADLSKEDVETEEQWNRKQQLTPEEILDGIQLALDAAGFVPGLGAVPDLLNAAISALRGDMVNAGLSLVAAVPCIGDAAAAVKIANNGIKAAKATRVAKTSRKAVDAATKSTSEKVIDLSKKRAEKRDKLIDESDNVVRFPSKSSQGKTKAAKNEITKQRTNGVIHTSNYEHKVIKRVNGTNETVIIKKTDTIVDSIDPSRGVTPISPVFSMGSSTSGKPNQGFTNNKSKKSEGRWPQKTKEEQEKNFFSKGSHKSDGGLDFNA